jgi:hypothetical protein
MRKTLKVIVFLMLSLVSVIGGIRFFVTPAKAIQLPSAYPLVYVYPNNVTCTVNENFEITVIVYNLTNAQVPVLTSEDTSASSCLENVLDSETASRSSWLETLRHSADRQEPRWLGYFRKA